MPLHREAYTDGSRCELHAGGPRGRELRLATEASIHPGDCHVDGAVVGRAKTNQHEGSQRSVAFAKVVGEVASGRR